MGDFIVLPKLILFSNFLVPQWYPINLNVSFLIIGQPEEPFSVEQLCSKSILFSLIDVIKPGENDIFHLLMDNE